MHDINIRGVQHGAIAVSASGATEIRAAVAGHRIVLLAYNFMSNGIVNVKWQSGSTDITGLAYLVEAGRGKVVPFNPRGWAVTAVGEALNINLSGAIAVGGEAVWAIVAP